MHKKICVVVLLSIFGISVCGYTVARAYTFTTPIERGDEGSTVVGLQEVLRDQGYFTYPEITGYFGPATETAVQQFQTAHHIISYGTPESTGFGRVGPQTITLLNSIQTHSLPTTPEHTATTTTTSSLSVPVFVRDLQWGMEGEDVRALQKFLNAHGFFVADSGPGSLGNETTFFLTKTQFALARFQKASGIAPAEGYLGPLTKGKIVEQLVQTAGVNAADVSAQFVTSDGAFADETEAALAAPAALSTLKVTSESNSYIKLTWKAVPGAETYVVKRQDDHASGFIEIALGLTDVAYTDRSVERGEEYTYVVVAKNQFGTSADSNEVSGRARSSGGGGGGSSGGGGGGSESDTTAPTVALTTPEDTDTVSGATVTVSADASDDTGVVGVQFKRDGTALGSEDTSAPYSIVWDSTTVDDDSYSLVAVARDAAGNYATSSAVTVATQNQYQFDYLFTGAEPAWTGATYQPAAGTVPTLRSTSSLAVTTENMTVVPSEPAGSAEDDIVIVAARSVVSDATDNLSVTGGSWTPLGTMMTDHGGGVFEQWGAWWARRGSGALTMPTVTTDGTVSGGGGLYAIAYAIEGAATEGTPFEDISTTTAISVNTMTGADIDTTGSTRYLVNIFAAGPDFLSNPGTGWTEESEVITALGPDSTFVFDSQSTTGSAPDTFDGESRAAGTTVNYGAWSFAVLPSVDQSFALFTGGVGYFYGGPQVGATVGKSQLNQEFDAPDGSDYKLAEIDDTVRVAFQVYFAKVPSGGLDGIKVLDVECKNCYPGINPGIRLDVDEGKWRLERSKLGAGLTPLYQSSLTTIPSGEWIDMVWEMTLGDTSGTNKLWMDDELILDEDGVNMPLTAHAGVTLNEEGVDRIQAGVTANSNAESTLLYLDNVDLTVTFR